MITKLQVTNSIFDNDRKYNSTIASCCFIQKGTDSTKFNNSTVLYERLETISTVPFDLIQISNETLHEKPQITYSITWRGSSMFLFKIVNLSIVVPSSSRQSLLWHWPGG